jgi:hypothetical protein
MTPAEVDALDDDVYAAFVRLMVDHARALAKTRR